MNKTNFRVFLLSSTIFDLALGFFGPFWFFFISDFGGGVEQFSYAISLMMVASAVTSFFAGKYSDSFGRKPFLVTSGVGLSIIIFSYTLVENIPVLYFLQVLYGIFLAAQGTAEAAIVGDLTEKASRGIDIGMLHLFTQLAAAGAVLLAGLIGSMFGVNVVFYIAAVLMLFSVVAISQLKEA